jgi:hypothetical protein
MLRGFTLIKKNATSITKHVDAGNKRSIITFFVSFFKNFFFFFLGGGGYVISRFAGKLSRS